MNVKFVILFLLVVIANVLCCKPNMQKEKFKLNDSIKVDMQGYRSDDKKYFVLTGKASTFYLVSAEDNSIVFEGKSDESINDSSSGDKCSIGDFSEVNKEGKYYIVIPNYGKSYTFTINNNVFNDVFYKAMRGFYLQRCGIVVEDKGGWGHKACHLDDAVFDEATNEKGKKDVTGGWHDAGDYGKYIVSSGITAGTMLLMYERKKDILDKVKLDIPESNNNTPDVLDEIKWNIDWMLKMQRADGAVYHKVGPKLWPDFIQPEKDKGIRYIYQISTCATADFAAVTAMAARIYKPYDKDFSAECMKASVKAWEFLSKNSKMLPEGGYNESAGSGPYNDKDEFTENSVSKNI